MWHLSDQPEPSFWWFVRYSMINIENNIIFCAHMYEATCETQLMLSMHECDFSPESLRDVLRQISFVCLCVLSISHTSLTILSNTYLQFSECVKPFQRIAERSVSMSFRLVKETLGKKRCHSCDLP